MVDIGRSAVDSASTGPVAVSGPEAVPLPAAVGIVALDWGGATVVGPVAISIVVGALAWVDTASSSVAAEAADAAAAVVGVVS